MCVLPEIHARRQENTASTFPLVRNDLCASHESLLSDCIACSSRPTGSFHLEHLCQNDQLFRGTFTKITALSADVHVVQNRDSYMDMTTDSSVRRAIVAGVGVGLFGAGSTPWKTSSLIPFLDVVSGHQTAK
jgi:hypothetical protein